MVQPEYSPRQQSSHSSQEENPEMTGIAVKSEAGKPLTSSRAWLNRPTLEQAEGSVAKGSSLSFHTLNGKCGMHYEKAITCIEEFGRTIA